ncbi:hypothetical protein [Carnobacterium divergens]|nr:hypothetical protein [Carnobacterium divergens]MDT2011140.1 hypothetical protein [Carnobacterium divergens]
MREQIKTILIIAQQQLNDLSEDEKEAKYYLNQIVESAEVLLNSGY